MAESGRLPPPGSDQAYISPSILSGGYLHLPGRLFVEGAREDETLICPSMSWLLTHNSKSNSGSRRNLIFDLGLRRDTENYPPAVHKRLQTVVPVTVEHDVFDSLADRGLDPQTDIETVVFSHLHYDHVGDPGPFGPRTQFIVGPSAASSLLRDEKKSYPANEHGHFDSRLLPPDRTVELTTPSSQGAGEGEGERDGYWTPLGPFPHAHDLFNDSSLYIINAPGHLTGHINLLARISDTENKWLYLAGDTAHDVRILDGSRGIAVYPDPENLGVCKCAHADKEGAEEHLARVRSLRDENPGVVEVVLAHDGGWLERNGKRFGARAHS